MKFEEIVRGTSQIENCYRRGLQALGNNSQYVRCGRPKHLSGSVDLDTCLREKYRYATRWDYAIACAETIYFLEVHPASTSNVNEMIQKHAWLLHWLQTEGPLLNKQKRQFHWVATNGVKFTAASSYGKRLAQAGLNMPKSALVIP